MAHLANNAERFLQFQPLLNLLTHASNVRSTLQGGFRGGFNTMKKKGLWEAILRMLIAAATAALTALGTTSCMGQGPIML